MAQDALRLLATVAQHTKGVHLGALLVLKIFLVPVKRLSCAPLSSRLVTGCQGIQQEDPETMHSHEAITRTEQDGAAGRGARGAPAMSARSWKMSLRIGDTTSAHSFSTCEHQVPSKLPAMGPPATFHRHGLSSCARGLNGGRWQRCSNVHMLAAGRRTHALGSTCLVRQHCGQPHFVRILRCQTLVQDVPYLLRISPE